jgi:Tuberculosis necrotizing toxin
MQPGSARRQFVRRIRFLIVAVVAAAGLASNALAGPVGAAARTAVTAVDTCAAPLDGDPRLGPAVLPTTGPAGATVLGYDRFGGLTKDQFLARYWDPVANAARGSWLYPPDDGFLANLKLAVTLPPGKTIDRFGSEFGAFLAPALSLYGQRAIPPQNLNTFDPAYPCNYHAYKVLKPFSVRLGLVAPWFHQLGLGVQEKLDSALVPGAPTPLSVLWLVDNGYLQRLN